MDTGLAAEPTAAVLAVICSGSCQKGDLNLQEKKTNAPHHSVLLPHCCKNKYQTSKQNTSNGYQLISQLLTKIYEAISYECFWTLLVAAQPAIPSGFEPLFFGVW